MGGGIRGKETFLHLYFPRRRAHNDVYSRSPPGFGEAPRPHDDHTYRLVERRRLALPGVQGVGFIIISIIRLIRLTFLLIIIISSIIIIIIVISHA